jgi:PGF-CTERM protein
VIEIKINGNTKVFSEVVADAYSTYLAYLLIPLEADLYGYPMGPMEYLPLVIPASSGGEIAEEDVVVIEDDSGTIFVYAEETDAQHSAQADADTGITQIWQAQDTVDPSNYITMTIDGYTGDIPPIGGGDIPYDEFDWDNFTWDEDWDEDWDWESLDIDWDEYDWECGDMELDVWCDGYDDLEYDEMDWDALGAEWDALEDWDWEEEGLEDLGLYFEINSDDEINFMHVEIDIEVDKDTDTSTIKLYYLDEDTEIWVKIETSGYNEDTGKLEADIDHLTVFAAMAEDTDGDKVDKDDAPGFAAVLVLFGLAGAVLFLRRK